jgi:predicted thioesterase
VLGTPRLLAWCEAACCAAIDPHLPKGETSVSSKVQLEHLVPSAVGHRVEVTARLSYADGRLRRFSIAARNIGPDGPGTLVASGEASRVVVDAHRFMAKVSGTPDSP